MLNITQIPAPRVPLIDERTGLISREWFRFFNNIYLLTGGGGNQTSLDDLQIGPPNNDQFVLDLQQIFESATNDTALISSLTELAKEVEATALSNEAVTNLMQAKIDSLANDIQALAVAPPTTPQIRRRAYGSFFDVNDQTAAAINTAYAMSFSNTDYSNGVYLGSPTSRVYVDRYGLYNIQFSAQLDKSSASLGNVWIWLDKNGTTVPSTATQISLQGSNSATVAAWNFLLELNAGDYFRLMWSTNDTNCFIKHDTAVAPVPEIPSIILTVTDNIIAYQD